MNKPFINGKGKCEKWALCLGNKAKEQGKGEGGQFYKSLLPLAKKYVTN